jgi:hypothetical protein
MNNSDLHKLANKLGFGTVKSFSKMYNGGTLNAYGKNDCSFTMFTIGLNKDFNVIGVEVTTKYLQPTKQTIFLNSLCNFENPRSVKDLLMNEFSQKN